MSASLLVLALLGCDGGEKLDDTGGGEPIEACAEVYQESQVGLPGEDAAPSGYLYCWTDDDAEGAFNREEAVSCATDTRDLVPACDESSDDGECAADADCADAEACVCAAGAWFDDGGGYRSFYTAGECRPADCRTSADCESGACGVSFDICGYATEGLHCRTAADECRSDSDCEGGRAACRFLADEGRWGCYELADCE